VGRTNVLDCCLSCNLYNQVQTQAHRQFAIQKLMMDGPQQVAPLLRSSKPSSMTDKWYWWQRWPRAASTKLPVWSARFVWAFSATTSDLQEASMSSPLHLRQILYLWRSHDKSKYWVTYFSLFLAEIFVHPGIGSSNQSDQFCRIWWVR